MSSDAREGTTDEGKQYNGGKMRLSEVGLCPVDSNVQTKEATLENEKGMKDESSAIRSFFNRIQR